MGGGGGLGQFANLREDLARKNGVLFLKGVGGGVGWGWGRWVDTPMYTMAVPTMES